MLANLWDTSHGQRYLEAHFISRASGEHRSCFYELKITHPTMVFVVLDLGVFCCVVRIGLLVRLQIFL
uniref:Uncharacterized protein n=1 Tax=Engystomops pustulosus TaxID=76066 RepID=A0AAV6YSX8_ENGPU|nr:hypothetical protein GDO81_021224 [Engystomops pustulosus]